MKKNLLPKLVLPILVASSTIIGANNTKVSAAPINDAGVKLTQPDGQVIQCYSSEMNSITIYMIQMEEL